MKKSFYLLAVVGVIIVGGASVFVVARLKPKRLNEVKRQLNKNPNMSSHELQALLDEVIAANEVLLKNRLERDIRRAKIREKREMLQRENAELVEEKEMLGAELQALQQGSESSSESTEPTEE